MANMEGKTSDFTMETTPQKNVFNAWKFRHLFTFQSMRGKNIVVMCNLCLPKVNLLSTSSMSTSNLNKHLERKHGQGLQLFSTKRQNKRKKTGVPGDDPGAGPSDESIIWDPQHTIVKLEAVDESPAPVQATPPQSEAQLVMDSVLFNYMLEDLQPPTLLRRPAFRRLVQGLSGGSGVMSPTAMEARLQMEFLKMKLQLKARLDRVASVCTTVDMWVTRKRVYLVIMCYWVDPCDLTRQTAVLSCSMLHDGVTYDSVTSKIQEVHAEYGIDNKVEVMLTNSGSGCCQAFSEFTCTATQGEDDYDDGGGSKTLEFIDVDALLSEPPLECSIVVLPPHQPCVSHTLSLVATEDLPRALNQYSSGAVFSRVIAKCSALRPLPHPQERHGNGSGAGVHDGLELDKPLHQNSRWSSEYQMLDSLASLGEEALAELCDQQGVARLVPEEVAFLREYVRVLKPLAISLSLFQVEDRGFYGLAIPTLLKLKQKLGDERGGRTDSWGDNGGARFFSSSLIDALIAAIDQRFAHVLSSHNAKMAAATLPQFRLWWVTGAERDELEAGLAAEVAQWESPAKIGGTTSADVSLEDDFFDFGSEGSGKGSDVQGEIVRYLEGTTKTLHCVRDFPNVFKLFLRYNCVLTSSAPVERLLRFSSHQHQHLHHQHLEQMILLRYNMLQSYFGL